jgi:CubicO group peptidase (beta-lactamase class C family)
LTGLPDPYPLYTGFDGALRFRDDNSLLTLVNNLEASDEDLQTVWTYNSLVYALLSPLVENLSGLSFADFMKTRIFTPLGLRNTSIVTCKSEVGNSTAERAKPYVILEGNSVRELPTMTFDGNGFAASFGMASSTEDLLVWSQAVIEAAKMDFSMPISSSRQQLLAAIRRTIEPGCQIQVTNDGVMSYRTGWFHTTGQSISFDIFYNLTVGSASQIDFPMIAGANQQSNCNSSPENDTFKRGSRSILYSNGYIKGFTSNIHIYPDLGHAVVVLGNSTGRSEPCGYISRLLTALICGDEVPPDLIAVLKEEVEEFASRWETLAHALGSDRRQCHTTVQSDRTRFVGCYRNAEIGLEMKIQACSDGTSASGSLTFDEAGPLLFSFGDQLEVQLPLWYYEENVLCFFPPKDKFERAIMPPFADASQYLLHMHTEAENAPASGLWWQYDRAFDALWLSRQAPP